MDFVEYLSSLAQEGEMMLFVKQKQKADGGYTYIPYTREKMERNRADGAWFANTGIYIVDRFENGKLSASASYIEYVAVMMLDDVGTKAKTPPVPPTWIMETSPGNYQWGYTFSEQPGKAEYCAAIKAITTAGYGDTGATNAVRNFRIPGSVNLKPQHNGFKSRLVEFHPEREYTLEYLCAAMGVEIGEVPKPMQPIRLADNGGDDVMQWLDEHGLVLEAPNAQGWMGVICPNKDQHTDGNPMGRYNPSTRSYSCFHGHCEHVDSATFLQWVADNGGPQHEAGLRDDLLAETMLGVYAKLDKEAIYDKDTGVFSESSSAEAIIAEVERKSAARTEKQKLHERFAYVASDNSYFDLFTRREYKRDVFDAMFRHLDTRSRFGKNPRVGAGVWFDENRNDYNGQMLTGIAYAPGGGTLVAREGDVYGNKWVDGRPEGKDGDIAPYMALLERVVPDAMEREHILNVFAYKRQHPEHKINHAILMIGKPGIGKDSIYAPFLWSIGGTGQRNVHIIKEGAELVSNFGYALENEVIVLNELRQPEGRDRRAMENSLKPIIAAPPEYLSVNRKNAHPYDALNRILVLAGSNHDVPIALPSDDRRWFVVKSSADPLTSEEAKRLWKWYLSGGFEAICGWLERRDVSAFDPGARPPMTEAKECMVEQGHSSAESYLIDLIRSGKGEFANGVMGGPWHGLIDRLQATAPHGAKLYQQALFHAFNEAGWVDMGRLMSRDYSSKRHVYASPEMAAAHSKTELRRMAEPDAGTGPGLVAVK